MKQSNFVKLGLPEYTDVVDVKILSDNFKIIDEMIQNSTYQVTKETTYIQTAVYPPYYFIINDTDEDITYTDIDGNSNVIEAHDIIEEPLSTGTKVITFSSDSPLKYKYFIPVTNIETGGGGTSDYSELSNKPKFNNIELQSGANNATDMGFVTWMQQSLTTPQKAMARSNIDAGTYSKPTAGIPKTDLSEAVQLSLGRADTALQTEAHTGDYSKPSGGIPKTDLAAAVQNSLSLADTALQTEAHTGDYSKPSGGIPASDMTQSVQEALGKAHSHDNKSVLDGITAEKITQIGTNKSDISTIKGYINNGDSEAKNGTTCTINVPENVSDFASIAMVGGKTEKVTPESGDPYLVSAPVEKIVSKNSSGVVKTELSLTEIVKNLPDYGLGIDDNYYNYIDFETGKYYHKVFMIDIGNESVRQYASKEYIKIIDKYGVASSVRVKIKGNVGISNTLENETTSISEVGEGEFRASDYIYYYDDGDVTTSAERFAGTKIILALATPEVIDLADTLYPIECESGGTITFVNEHNLDVPNKVIYKKEV